MTTRTDGEIEAVYKAGHAHSHAAGLREVYQAGRADEAHALLSHSKAAQEEQGDEKPKREIKNPGAPVSGVTLQPESDASASVVGDPPEAPANTAPGQPAPGQNPPGEHPPSQA